MNYQVGLARAEAVKQYLGEQHEIPGDCISVVSYGMEKPVADNSTPEGRAQNRRVVSQGGGLMSWPERANGHGCVVKKRRRVRAHQGLAAACYGRN